MQTENRENINMPNFDWETPKDFFNTLNEEFNFDIDVAATKENAKLPVYFTPEINGLGQSWKGVCWMNPPYNRDIGLWMKKAYEESQKGNRIVALIQGRSTDTIWWHNYVMKSDEIRFIKNRLHFSLNGNFARANISNVIIVFRPYCIGPPHVSSIDVYGKKLY